MELLQSLDFVEILKTGAIGLGFLLALLSFFLLRKEQQKENPSKVIISSIIVFMIFSLLIMIFGILSQLFDESETLSLQLGQNELTVSKIKTVSTSKVNLDKFYASSEHQFAFKIPNSNWSTVKSESGVSGLYKLMGIKSSYITEESLRLGLSRSPVGSLLSGSEFYFFENPSTKILVSPSDSVTNSEIELSVSNYSETLTDTTRWFFYDTTNVDEKREYEEDLINYRKNLVLFDTLEVKESFILYVMPKDSLSSQYRNLTLPALFTSLTSVFGINSDKLVADENQILIGVETELKNLLSNNSLIDIKAKKWMLFTENESYFFIVELTFPQQYKTSVDRWDELQETLDSFVKLK